MNEFHGFGYGNCVQSTFNWTAIKTYGTNWLDRRQRIKNPIETSASELEQMNKFMCSLILNSWCLNCHLQTKFQGLAHDKLFGTLREKIKMLKSNVINNNRSQIKRRSKSKVFETHRIEWGPFISFLCLHLFFYSLSHHYFNHLWFLAKHFMYVT